jgi:DNA-binding NarL/FixJ family response regulator
MNQNKVILIAERDDAVYSLIGAALGKTAPACSLVHLGTGSLLAGMLFGDQLAPDTAYILILDEDCPEHGSKEILSRMKKNSRTTRIPVVVLIGSDEEKIVNEYQALGASTCILKSDEKDALSDTIARLGSFLTVVQVPGL